MEPDQKVRFMVLTPGLLLVLMWWVSHWFLVIGSVFLIAHFVVVIAQLSGYDDEESDNG